MNSHHTDQTSNLPPTSGEEELNHVMAARREKLDRLNQLGVEPYPYAFARSHSVDQILTQFSQLESEGANLHLAGRIMSLRLMGKAAFAHIQDVDSRLQIYIKKDLVGERAWEVFRLLDIGDIIGVTGTLFITHTGEQTLRVSELQLLAKNLRPLPAVKEKDGAVWYRWDDKEERYRNRSLDLIMNRDSRRIFMQRSQIVSEIRRFMSELSFIEVETPVLQPLYGGAAARPFTTFYNSLNHDFYLRIADELYLKRLITGGFPRVFEIAKDFRNEGLDRLHAPEFTMLECYAAYEDYSFCASLIEDLLLRLAMAVNSKPQLNFNDDDIDVTPPFRRATMANLVREACGIEIVGRDRDDLAREASAVGISIEKNWNVGRIIDELVSEKVAPLLIQPTFMFDYPVELSPLAKRHRSQPGLVERFELFIGGLEIANAFSELNDPLDQRRRFEEQAKLRASGDEEAHPIDDNFIEALELGMPPTSGMGVGIDRLVMLLTGAVSIRDVILFPALRPRE
ncbi:MAG: lysine--tRNA ligase [Calditrichota bacterium]